jgi:hypothetical protein
MLYRADGESQVFDSADDVPADGGWKTLDEINGIEAADDDDDGDDVGDVEVGDSGGVMDAAAPAHYQSPEREEPYPCPPFMPPTGTATRRSPPRVSCLKSRR